MKQYYYLDNNQQTGPFTLEQLRTQPIGLNTLVWTDGMTNWTCVADVPEVRESMGLGGSPPNTLQPVYGASSQPIYGQPNFAQPNYAFNGPGGFMPKTWLTESILVTLFCCMPFGVVGIINAS